jgi:hypothetical protein
MNAISAPFVLSGNTIRIALARVILASVPPSCEVSGLHRVAFYTVRIRPKGQPSAEGALLGDIDDEGTSLRGLLDEFSENFAEDNEEGTRSVRCESHSVVGHEDLRVSFRHGQSGIAADIFNPSGQLKAHQDPQDDHLVKCGALFRLPPTQRLGWLAVHINNGRGITGLLRKGLRRRFRERYEDLVLEIVPFIDESAFQKAVEDDPIDPYWDTLGSSPACCGAA